MAASGRGIDLCELLENALQLVRWNADAGILDPDIEKGGVVLHLTGYVDQNMAILGELDGIAEQVGDDLPKPADITHDVMRQARVDTDDELEVFLGDTRRDQRRHVLHRLIEAERVGIERKLAGIDLGEV